MSIIANERIKLNNKNDKLEKSSLFTILTSLNSERLAKSFCRNDKGEIQSSFPKIKYFGAEQIAVNNLKELYDRIEKLGKNQCIIRGIADKKTLSKTCRNGSIFKEHQNLNFVCFDIDGVLLKEIRNDIDYYYHESIDLMIKSKFPSEFQNISYIYKFSSSAGILNLDKTFYKPGFRVNIYFWLNKSTTQKELKVWLKDLIKDEIVDPSMFNPVTMHLGDHRNLSGNVKIKQFKRLGFIQKESDFIIVPKIETNRVSLNKTTKDPSLDVKKNTSENVKPWISFFKKINCYFHHNEETVNLKHKNEKTPGGYFIFFNDPLKVHHHNKSRIPLNIAQWLAIYVDIDYMAEFQLLLQKIYEVNGCDEIDVPGYLRVSDEFGFFEQKLNNVKAGMPLQTITTLYKDKFRQITTITAINEKMAITHYGGRSCLIEMDIDKNTGQYFYKKNKDESKIRLKNKYIDIKKYDPKKNCYVHDLTPSHHHWFNHSERREYESIYFEPKDNFLEDQKYNRLNTWSGFAVDYSLMGTIQNPEEKCQLMLSHIKKVICDDDERKFEYVLNWLAHAVQKPYEMPRVALVLMSGQGTGKGKFVDFVSKIFGVYFTKVTSSKHIVGNFNAHLDNTLLLFADEAFWGGNKSNEGIFKGLITEETRMSEAKGFDPVQIKSYLRIIFSSNNEYPVPVERDDRRVMILSVSEKRKNDTQYFSALDAECKQTGSKEAFLKYLIDRDIEGYDFVAERVNSEELFNLKMLHASSFDKWLYDFLDRGTVIGCGDYDNWTHAPFNLCRLEKNIIYCQQLFNDYETFTKKNCYERPLSDAHFGRKLKTFFEKKMDKKRFPYGEVRRYRYFLPSLDEMIQIFCQKWGISSENLNHNVPIEEPADLKLFEHANEDEKVIYEKPDAYAGPTKFTENGGDGSFCHKTVIDTKRYAEIKRFNERNSIENLECEVSDENEIMDYFRS